MFKVCLVSFESLYASESLALISESEGLAASRSRFVGKAIVDKFGKLGGQ